MDPRYLWGKLLQAVQRGDLLPRLERLKLLAYVLESTDDPVIIEHTYRMVRGHLKLEDVEPHVDEAFYFTAPELAKRPAVLHRVSANILSATRVTKKFLLRR